MNTPFIIGEGLTGSVTRVWEKEPLPPVFEWTELWTAMKESPDVWIPTTEDMYWDMLECVPPRATFGRAFLVGEAERHNAHGEAVYACFNEVGNEVFAKYMTVAEFKREFKGI